MIETPGLPPEQLSLAYGLRALGYSLKGWFDKAARRLRQGDRFQPRFRSRTQQSGVGLLQARPPAAGRRRRRTGAANWHPATPMRSTRARTSISRLGDAAAALSDYELAMRYGGETIVKLYQCGLRSQGLYFGALDGVYSSDVKRALHVCINRNAAAIRSPATRIASPRSPDLGVCGNRSSVNCATAAFNRVNRCSASENLPPRRLDARTSLAHCAPAAESWTGPADFRKSNKVQV